MRRKDREVTDRNGIEKILNQCKTCHLAMVDNGSPYLVPLSYGYRILAGHVLELFFHSAREGRKINVLKRNNRVCFTMTHRGGLARSGAPCGFGYSFSSVIGSGEAVFIDDIDEKRKALSVMFKHQAGTDVTFTAEQARDVCVFKVVSADFTGKTKPEP